MAQTFTQIIQVEAHMVSKLEDYAPSALSQAVQQALTDFFKQREAQAPAAPKA
jgi:trimethylamine:corrinoid methyltransferase-like protein